MRPTLGTVQPFMPMTVPTSREPSTPSPHPSTSFSSSLFSQHVSRALQRLRPNHLPALPSAATLSWSDWTKPPSPSHLGSLPEVVALTPTLFLQPKLLQ